MLPGLRFEDIADCLVGRVMGSDGDDSVLNQG